MFWAKTGRAVIAAAMAAGALIVAVPAQAGVVVKSSGPSAKEFPVGKKLDDTARITLKAGDTVTILNAKGTRVLKGAGTYRVGARGGATRVKMANLTRQSSAVRVRTGAARAGGGEVRSPNLWYVDVTQSGRMCVPDLGAVILWRPTSEGDETYIFGPTGTQYHYHVEFADRAMEMPVDNERLTLAAGKPYEISGPGGTVTKVEFQALENASEDPEVLAETLIENGCTNQLELLSQSLLANTG